MKELKAREYKHFEDIKQIRADVTEFWSVRELAPALEYTKWENIHNVIIRVMIVCENSGHSVEDDFPELRKIFATMSSDEFNKSQNYGAI